MYDERIDGAPVTVDEGLMVPTDPATNHAMLPIIIDWENGTAMPFSWNGFDIKSEEMPAFGAWTLDGMVELAERIIAGEEVVIQYNAGAAGLVPYMGVMLPISYARADAIKAYADETDPGSFGAYLITAVVRSAPMGLPDALLMIEASLGGDNAGVHATIHYF